MPVPAQRVPASRRLLRDHAYAQLRGAILAGTLRPGERLRDAELCEWLDLSRTPVREALARLEEDGLVETSPQRYTRVAPLDRRDAADAFQVVAAVHALAAELAVPRLAAAHLEALREDNARFAAALDAADVDAALAADDAFHDVFVQASGNEEIARTLERLMPRLRRLERLRFGSLAARRSVRQHRRIAQLAGRGDTAAVAAAVRENWLSLGALIDRSFAPDDATTPTTTRSPS
jgi:DNA-binding GntR family transcriptional regulator